MDEPLVTTGTSFKKKRSLVSQRPNVVWKEAHRSTYLDELIRQSGRGDFMATQCPDCVARKAQKPNNPIYRCLECLVPDLCCKECCIRRHRTQPLHRIEMWQGSHYDPVSLKSLGLKIQLNHSGSFCESPSPCHSGMIVIHTNGLHEVSFNYCGCARAIPQHIQLLRRGYYPASQSIVRTCATLGVLNLLHKFAVTTKGSTYDFYRALDMLTNNTGVGGFTSRYRSLFRMGMQWRHLKLLKRAGRGHVSGGPDSTAPGELAVRCPSCPYPGINLPDDWEEAPPEMKFLYTAFICMDANFRLKNQLVSNYSQDPGLGIGLAYMVPRAPYEAYVLGRANDEDISTCVGLQAIAQANTRFSKGLRYTGVGGVFCGRSEMVMPNGIGNLHKGERYSNMDFVFASAVQFLAVTSILISYNVACQWFINLFKRMTEHWPENIRIPSSTKITPAIPKLHEPMHGRKNHQQFSLNYIPGVGNSDFKGPERVWAPHNPVGNSTKTQGPGSRQDNLDDQFSAWNWWKYIGIGSILMRRYQQGVSDRNIQVEAHRGLTNSIGKDLADRWEAMCVAWEEETELPKKKKNPYETEGVAITEAEAKKQLAADEEKRLNAGGVALHTTSAPAFVSMGLDIEDSQRRLHRLAKTTGNSSTAHQDGNLTEQRNQLTARLRVWEQLLPIYMPGLLQYQANLRSSNSTVAEHPEDRTIWLPSQIPKESRTQVCSANLVGIEEKLRTAQCFDALDNIRHILKIKARLVKFKKNNVRGQREGTRSRAIIDRVHDRARFTAEKYRSARAAKLQLTGAGEWEKELKPLLDSEIRGYQDANHLQDKPGRRGTLEDGQEGKQTEVNKVNETGDFTLFEAERTKRDGTGETRRTLSWIWLTPENSDNPNQMKDNPDNANDELMRAEWAKSRARVNRAREEVQLVCEEMRRTLAYLTWRASWWISRGNLRQVDKAMAEGLQAESEVQASVQRLLAKHFQTLWKDPLGLSTTITNPSSAVAVDNPDRNSGTVENGGIEEDDEEDDEDEDREDYNSDAYDDEDDNTPRTYLPMPSTTALEGLP